MVIANDSGLAKQVERFLRANEPHHKRTDWLVAMLVALLPLAVGCLIYRLAQSYWIAVPAALGGGLLVLLISLLLGGSICQIELRSTTVKFLKQFPAAGEDYPAALALLAQLMNSKLAADLLKQLPGGTVAAAAGVAETGEHKGWSASQLQKLLVSSGVAVTITSTTKKAVHAGLAKAGSGLPFHNWIAAQNAKQVADLTPAPVDYAPYKTSAAAPATSKPQPVTPKITGDGFKAKPAKAKKAPPPAVSVRPPTPLYIPLDPFKTNDDGAAQSTNTAEGAP